jgi:uncharacterized damage-inducible protein DinB
MNAESYLADVKKRFLEARSQCDRALAQVDPSLWTQRPHPESNSLATLMQHLAGNMLSRWRDFFDSDGEKPTRDRDAEFEDPAAPSVPELKERWEAGWRCLFEALDTIGPGDLDRVVTIRSQPHTVVEALDRQMTHYAYHAGQIVFLAKLLVGESFESLTIPRKRRESRPL